MLQSPDLSAAPACSQKMGTCTFSTTECHSSSLGAGISYQMMPWNLPLWEDRITQSTCMLGPTPLGTVTDTKEDLH